MDELTSGRPLAVASGTKESSASPTQLVSMHLIDDE